MPRHGRISACLLVALTSAPLLDAFRASSDVGRRTIERFAQQRPNPNPAGRRERRFRLSPVASFTTEAAGSTDRSTSALRRPSTSCRRNDASSSKDSFTNRKRSADSASVPVQASSRTRLSSRRQLLLIALTATQLVTVTAAAPPAVRAASSSSSVPTSTPPLNQIQESIDALQSLVDNWSVAVVDCMYADVPRELLETKNKAELLEKAKTSALFDKSASVVSCKTSNRIVRDYLGSTGKGPVVTLDKALRQGLDQLSGDDDVVEEYLQLVENVQSDLSKADSLSYAAGVSDLSAINNFDRDIETTDLASNSSLREAKTAIQSAISSLNRIVSLLTAS